MGDEVPDVNTHIYQEQYFASDDEDGIEDFDFPDNDTLNDSRFEIGESSNSNLGKDANHVEDENHLVDEDIEVNIDFTEGQSHDTHDYVSPGGTLYWTPIVSDDIKPKVTSKFDSYEKVVAMYRNYALESGFDVRLGRVKKRKMGLLHIDIWYEIGKEIFIHNMSTQNIGPVKAHRPYSALLVGPSVRGGLVSDFKNVRRNLNCYIGGRDAKFLVDKMNDRKKNVSSFTFEYKVLNKRLNALFWDDETTKYKYNSFRDVVSLDATFSVIWFLFRSLALITTKKCVTFGAGLLIKEDGVSYEWLLRAFLKAFRKQPQLFISDQDPALKKAIDTVFPSAHHRLCMWHITKKLPNKILSIEDAATNQKFRKRFHSIIWNYKSEPHDFENVWHTMLKEFKITDNSCMNTMYGMRRYWIPAFFKHILMSGLMRTTSLSESQNWSFQTTTLTGSYLIMLMMTFDSVMERQRHNKILNDFNTATNFPKFITRSPNEPHASKKKNNITTMQPTDVDVDEKDEEYNYDCLIRDTEYMVTHSTKDGSFKCTCMHFEHVGILCRHIFCVFKYYGIEQLPEKYILKRWRRDVIPTELLRRWFTNSFDDSNSNMTAIDIFNTVDHYDCPNHEVPTRIEHFNKLLGVVVPDVVSDVNDIQNPSDIRNKGCGSRGKRLKSKKEMIEKEISKPKTKCTICKQMAHHDKRNCPSNNVQT
ncbi:protein FAR1-RELATED SEQUENCE 5-like [Lactuca sativa]|uniref:protein FAR1-RELATED SEQUENCE 5-like n=1 Tax=Lactuca sativa TaxID=4236 RepID=UPI0022B03067|nr:protein FAR1-RELATED SEQUENCE 5-like [Lactuca sativa]